MIVLWVISILVIGGAIAAIAPGRYDNGRIFTKIFCWICLGIVLATLIAMGVQLWWRG